MKKFFKGKEAGTITPLPPASPPVSSPSFGTPRLFEEYQARVASQTASAESNRPLSYQAPSLSSHHPRESSDEARYAQSHLSASSSQRRRSQQPGVSPRQNQFPYQARATQAADAAYDSYSDPSSNLRPSYDRSNHSDYDLRSQPPSQQSHADRRHASKQLQPSSGMAASLPPRSLRPAQPAVSHRRDGSMSKPIASERAFPPQTRSGAANFSPSHSPPTHHPSADSNWVRHRRSQDSDDSDRAAYDDTAAPRSTAYPVYAGPEGEGDAGEVLISQGRYEETTLRDPPKDKSKGMKLFGFSTGSNKDKKAKQHRDDAPSSSPVPRSSRDRDDAHLMSPPVDAHPDSAPERSREGGWMDRWKKGAHQYQAARLQDKEAEDLVASRIGWITANAHEEQDWMHVLPIIDLVSQSEAASKEAARALRKEFKYGTVDTQRRAVRLWALLTLNASDRFRLQVASRRFLESIEDTIASSKTPLSVKETMLRVLGVLAFEFRNDADLAAVTKCWNKVKPSDRPKDGEPLKNDLFEFRLPQPFQQQQQSQQQQQQGPWRRTSQRYSEPSAPHPELAFSPPQQPPPTADPPTQLHRLSAAFPRTQKPQPPPPSQPTWQLPTSNGGPVDIISNLEAAAASMESKSYPASIASQHDIVAADEDVRRLHEECQIARSNAAVLLDTLLHEGLHGDTAELIDEFYGKVVHAQELIASQIAWASAQVERAKMAGGEGREEALLADLLEAHGRTSEAVRAVDEARRVAEEEEEERRVTERSKVEVRLDRSALAQDSTGELYDLTATRGRSGMLGVERGPQASGSRSPSPSGYSKPAVLSPGSGFSSNSSSILSPASHTTVSRGSSGATAPPRASRPLPVPRSDQSSDSSIHHSSAASSQHSRDASLTLPGGTGGGGRSPLPQTPALNIDTLQKGAMEEDDLQTPVVPSAKALGKRRAVSVRYPTPPPTNGETPQLPPLPGKTLANGMGGLRLG
ncbi:hypothetical protein PSEUBRA_005045 [Kalmanozyma brasiliensis GHG001]|uniref:uncharacterized protein n=1 Tax=Kalmanozyma brasiliensis (strain GHG001) TaxID=1365824 RepID=UPI002867D60C|nr:uncharacterized protein PSEUBRA_005045 [Kalmanozyma brasiliensis GHG001]EST05990.2 hypothetical protein PSEUBRA_005045 [Kalmanozyma brasiliensis GHG001]